MCICICTCNAIREKDLRRAASKRVEVLETQIAMIARMGLANYIQLNSEASEA